MAETARIEFSASQDFFLSFSLFFPFLPFSMSLTVDFLREYFARPDVTQADYAKLAGIDPSLLTKLMQEEVLISSKNLRKLLRGFPHFTDRVAFLNAYLRDQLPGEYADAISIRLVKTPESANEEGDQEESLLQAFEALPSDAYKRRVIRFVRQLGRDAELRRYFAMTMRYVDDGIATEREMGRATQDIFEDHRDAPTESLPATTTAKRKKA